MMNNTTKNVFCSVMDSNNPTGMVMNTKGFYFTLFPSESYNCLNLFWSSWTIQTRESFLFALLVVFLLCFLFEYIGHIRSKLSNKHTKKQIQEQQLLLTSHSLQPSYETILNLPEEKNETVYLSSIISLEDGIISKKEEKRKSSTSPLTIPTTSLSISSSSSFRIDNEKQIKHINPLLETFLYGIQIIIGYFLMIATMTYSIEILLTISLGHGLAYTFFIYNDPESNIITKSAHPCCDFITVDYIIQTMENKKIPQESQDTTSLLGSVSSQAHDNIMMTEYSTCCEHIDYQSITSSNISITSMDTSSLSEFMDCEYTLLMEK